MSEIKNIVIPITALKPHPRNYKIHPEKQIGRLRASVARFGQVRSIVAQEGANGSYLLVAGHGLTKAAKEEGLKELRVDVIPADWTPEQVEGYLVADNLLGATAEDDSTALAQILQEQANSGFDLATLGSSQEDLDALLASLANDYLEDEPTPGAGGDDFDITPEDGPTRSKVGDLWQLGRHRLLVGDSTISDNVAKLMGSDKADMVFTDPPYGISFKGQELSSTSINGVLIKHHKSANTKHDEIVNDSLQGDNLLEFCRKIVNRIKDIDASAWYICFSQIDLDLILRAMRENGLEWKSIIAWVKNQATLSAKDYKLRYEPIIYGQSGGAFYGERYLQEDVWEITRTLVNDLHPTMKPIPLVEKAINNSSPKNGLVIDLFLGSGTTLIAAERTGRKCYGIELEPKYADVILKRWEAESGKKAELVESPSKELTTIV